MPAHEFLLFVLPLVSSQAPWLARVDALFDRHHCSSLYLDVGTNVGVQLHKLFEPAKFGGAPVLQVRQVRPDPNLDAPSSS